MSTSSRRDLRRRMDRFVANPRCEANVRAVVHDVAMRVVAAQEWPSDLPLPDEQQSPFAIARGVQFEKALFTPPDRVLEALVRAGVLPARHGPARDLRLRVHGGPMTDLDASASATEALLRALAGASTDDPAALPAVLIAPAMKLSGGPLMPHGMFAADLLAVHLETAAPRVRLRVGEVKSWPDRGGHTDRAKLASARTQAGMYVHALRRTLDELGLSHAVAVADQGFLVLARPASNEPSVRWPEDLRWQARRAAAWWERLAAAAGALAVEGPAADPVAAVRAAATAYDEGCASFCVRATVCRARAQQAGDPAVLGPDVARLLGGVTLLRAEALLRGRARPASAAEEGLVARVAAADRTREACR